MAAKICRFYSPKCFCRRLLKPPPGMCLTLKKVDSQKS